MNYTLENEQLSITVQSFGGELVSIKGKNGIEYLWQGDANYWSGHAPVLFPICGSLRNNEALTKDGKKLTMPRHGIVRKREFNLEKQTASEIIFSIASDEELLSYYPYRFTLYIRYQLLADQVLVQYLVSNHSEETMPFFIGGHPGFNCPLENGLAFSDYQIEFEREEVLDVPTNELATGLVNRLQKKKLDFNGQTLPLSHDLFNEDALIFANSRSKKVTLSSSKGQHGLEMTFEDFSNLLIWSTANQAPFVALEPMMGTSTYTDEGDTFEEKENVQFLAPHGLSSYSYSIRCY